MAYEIGMHPGATWRRIDVQCHSPRDHAWRGSPALPGGGIIEEAARAAWAKEFVVKAMNKGLHVVALTDHHDVTFLPYVIQAARQLEGPTPVVLPGIEITCHDTVQCLALFDPSTGSEEWKRLLNKLKTVVPASDIEPRTAPVQQCGLTLEALFKEIDEDAVLSKCVLLIPHFGDETAHKSMNGDGWSSRARELSFDAVYIECHHRDLSPNTLDKIRGKIPEWGSTRRAILATGDNRHATWEKLGLHECWVKLGEVTVEALRQAFLADEARVAYEKPSTPTERIVEVEIQSTLTGETPLRLFFNEGFTAIIGGRGSGKSAVLEYLRFGLGKSETDVNPDEKSAKRRRAREAELIDETLSEGWVRVVLEREGLQESWFRSGAQAEVIVVTLSGGEEEHITIAAAQQRFPARAFHQKELSTTMLDAEAAAENITGIAAAEVIEDRRRNDQEVASAKRTITTSLQDVAAHWQSELELSQAQSVVEDIRRRLASIGETLQLSGVGAEDLDILADAPRYGRAQNYLDETARLIVDDRKQIMDVAERVLDLDKERYEQALSFQEITILNNKIVQSRSRVVELLEAAVKALDELSIERVAALSNFTRLGETFAARYAEAKERQAAHRNLIADSERLTIQLKKAAADEDIAAQKETGTRLALERFTQARTSLGTLIEQRYQLLDQAAKEVGDKSGCYLKARVKRDRRPDECLSALCNLLEGSRFREPEIHCADWLDRALKDDVAAGWTTICDAFLEIYRAKITAGGHGEPGAMISELLQRLFLGSQVSLTPHALNRVYANLTDQSLGALVSAAPRDSIALTYVSGRQSISFQKASSGQQASALLRLLLQQVAGTLIVDQPEDDLDNRVMMEIVQQVRTSKSTRQFIFATHNPNLVVNGDADKVISMVATVPEDRAPEGSARIKVAVDGAIETPAVRDTITSIMEGGLAAFNLRARKYRVGGVKQ